MMSDFEVDVEVLKTMMSGFEVDPSVTPRLSTDPFGS